MFEGRLGVRLALPRVEYISITDIARCWTMNAAVELEMNSYFALRWVLWRLSIHVLLPPDMHLANPPLDSTARTARTSCTTKFFARLRCTLVGQGEHGNGHDVVVLGGGNEPRERGRSEQQRLDRCEMKKSPLAAASWRQTLLAPFGRNQQISGGETIR